MKKDIELHLLKILPFLLAWLLTYIISPACSYSGLFLAFLLETAYARAIIKDLCVNYSQNKPYQRPNLDNYNIYFSISAAVLAIGYVVFLFVESYFLYRIYSTLFLALTLSMTLATLIIPPTFRWMTEGREYPVTLSRLVYSIFAMTAFLLIMFVFFLPFTVLIYRPLQRVWNGENFYHRLLQHISRFAIYHVPGTKFQMLNTTGESFSKPAVIISNHQSHLDLMCLLQMAPKIVVLTNDWVWNNHLYGEIIRTAEFYPVSNGFEQNLPHLRNLVARGYSIVVFPEGTRTLDGSISRFHKGAFTLARTLQVDILPVALHGVYEVLPKKDFMLRRGSMTLSVGQRIPTTGLTELDDLPLSRNTRHHYLTWLTTLRQTLETKEYKAIYAAYKAKYKIL